MAGGRRDKDGIVVLECQDEILKNVKSIDNNRQYLLY